MVPSCTILLWACSPYMIVLLVPSVIVAILTGGKLAVPPAIDVAVVAKDTLHRAQQGSLHA